MVLRPHDFSTDKHGWAELLPERAKPVRLSGHHRARWVIVGAGVTGLSCARRLAELHPDQEILLLDARQVGQGASGRNSGFAVGVSQFGGAFDSEQKENYQRVNRINQAGLDLLRTQVSQNAIACEWAESGFHHSAADQLSIAECAHFTGYLEALEIPHTVLGRDELQARLGTSLYQAGVHVPMGALLQPAALVSGLADSLPPNVTLYENSAVLGIKHGEPLILDIANGQVKADALILATNYESSKLGFLKRRLIGSTLSGSFTRVLSDEEFSGLGSLPEWGVLSLHGGGATVRLTADRRLCLRNTAEYHHATLLSDRQLAERQKIHRDAFEKRFPQLAHVPFEFSWSGVEGISRNGTNFFGRQQDNIYLAGGYNGSGVSRGTAFGAALADYASGEQSALISDCLASAPAAWIPPRPLLDIGAGFTVRLRFKGVGLDR